MACRFVSLLLFGRTPLVLPLVCLAADKQGALVACCRLLFQMIFVDGIEIDDPAISTISSSLNLDPVAFTRALNEAETVSQHETWLDEAQARGAFGVPTFFLGDRMFWGNDRLVLLEAALRQC